jgi:hypothetical protein
MDHDMDVNVTSNMATIAAENGRKMEMSFARMFFVRSQPASQPASQVRGFQED